MRLFLIDDRKIAASRAASEYAETVRRMRATPSPNHRAFKKLFDLIGCNFVTGQVLDVVIVPLELHLHSVKTTSTFGKG